MKKSLIALAVAGAMTAPLAAQADATLYGKFEQRLKFVSGDDFTNSDGDLVSGDKDWELEADDIRIGIKGDTPFDSDAISGFYKFEIEANPDDDGSSTAFSETADENLTVRYGLVGMKGSFGTVTIGRQANPAERIIAYTGNISEDTGVSDLNPDRVGSAISYVTPTFSGVNVYGVAVIEGESDDSQEDVDGYVFGADYSWQGLNLSASTWSVDKTFLGQTEDQDWVGLGGEYDFGAAKLGLIWENRESQNEDVDVWSVRGMYDLGNAELGANFHASDDDLGDEVDQFSLFAIYRLGDKASLDVEYVDTNNDTTDIDKETFSVAYTVKF